MLNVVMVGCSVQIIRAIEHGERDIRVFVVDDPDVIDKRGLHDLTERFRCVERVVAAPVQNEPWVDVPLPKGFTFQAALPGTEYGVPGAAVLSSKLGLRGLSARLGVAFRNKAVQRVFAESLQVAQPAFAECASYRELVGAFRALRTRCIVKPVDAQGSSGITTVSQPEELAEAWFRATQLSSDVTRASRGRGRTALIEEYVEGPEFSVEAELSSGVLVNMNVTRKRVLDGAFPVEIGHSLPVADERITRPIFEELGKLVCGMGASTAFLHSEWRIRHGRAVLMECAARLPGDNIMDLIDHAYDISVVDEFIQLHASPEAPSRWLPRRGAAIRFIGAKKGRLISIEGLENAQNSEGVIYAGVEVHPGDELEDMTMSDHRYGLCMTVGRDEYRAAARAERAAEGVQFVVR